MFAKGRLSVHAYSNGQTVWRYVSPLDTLAQIAAPGYFDAVSDTLVKNDIILMTGKDGVTMGYVEHVDDCRVVLAPLKPFPMEG